MCSLSEAAGKHPGIVGKWYGSVANLDSPGTALNTLLAQEGVFIHVARGIRLEKALQLVSILSAPSPLAAFRRILLVAEEGAQVSV